MNNIADARFVYGDEPLRHGGSGGLAVNFAHLPTGELWVLDGLTVLGQKDSRQHKAQKRRVLIKADALKKDVVEGQVLKLQQLKEHHAAKRRAEAQLQMRAILLDQIIVNCFCLFPCAVVRLPCRRSVGRQIREKAMDAVSPKTRDAQLDPLRRREHRVDEKRRGFRSLISFNHFHLCSSPSVRSVRNSSAYRQNSFGWTITSSACAMFGISRSSICGK